MLEAFRKFGLQHNDLPTMLDNASVLLRLLAVDINSQSSTRIPFITYVTSAVLAAIFFYTYQVSVYWFIFWRDGNDEVLFKILLFALAMSSLLGVNKVLYIHLNRKKLKHLVSEYLLCDAAEAADSRMRRNVQSTLRRVKRRATAFWVLLMVNGLLYVLRPFVIPGRHLMEDKQVILGLEPMFESPNYEIAYLAECLGVMFTVYAIASSTGFVIIIVGYTEMQMLALSQELLYLWKDAQLHCQTLENGCRTNDGCSQNVVINRISAHSKNFDNDRLVHKAAKNVTNRKLWKPFIKSELLMNVRISAEIGSSTWLTRQTVTRRYLFKSVATADLKTFEQPPQGCKGRSVNFLKNNTNINKYVKHSLIRVMKIHVINKNLISQVESVFQNAMAIEFLLLSVSLIAELLGGLENTYMQVPFAMVQVAMDCFTGQKLIDANTAFERAVYDCKWENFDVNNMKLVMVLLQNAQKTMKLSVGGVTSLGYVLFMSVIRSIYSAYTTLHSTLNK